MARLHLKVQVMKTDTVNAQVMEGAAINVNIWKKHGKQNYQVCNIVNVGRKELGFQTVSTFPSSTPSPLFSTSRTPHFFQPPKSAN